MNGKNIWFHVIIALVLVSMAAIVGQMVRWSSETPTYSTSNDSRGFSPSSVSSSQKIKDITVSRSSSESEPEVLVRFKQTVSLADIKKLASKNNDAVEDNIEAVNGLVAIDDLDNKSAESVAEQYAKLSDLVEYAEPNIQIKLDPNTGMQDLSENYDFDGDAVPNDPMFAEQWALNNEGQNGGKSKADISAVEAWKKTKGSKKVVVAVLDTGVDYNHQDLATNMWFRPENIPAYEDAELGTINDINGFDADANLQDPMDDNGHGTHCAGVIGAEGDNSEGIAGVNWEVQIMPLKFLSRGGFGSTKNAIEAINYVIDRKRAGVNIRIVSNSWGSTAKSKALGDVIKVAGEEGILFIAAAGNDGSDNDKRPHYPSNYDLPNMVSVAALDRNDNLAGFSNFGIKTVHVAAPGKDIMSTWINATYREASGTSMATPYVSGVAALIAAQNPRISVEKLREKLVNSVDKIDSLKDKIKSGGRINAAKAVN
jgi:subtilisin family serine protease